MPALDRIDCIVHSFAEVTAVKLRSILFAISMRVSMHLVVAMGGVVDANCLSATWSPGAETSKTIA
jgi:hypothetical protein